MLLHETTIFFSKADRGDMYMVHNQKCSYHTLLPLAEITDRGQLRQNMRQAEYFGGLLICNATSDRPENG